MEERSKRPQRRLRKSERGILSARPAARFTPIRAGLHKLRIGAERDGVFVVPGSQGTRGKSPLIVALHGAGGNGHDALQHFRHSAEELGIIVLAPDSRGKTWNARKEDWAPDVDFVDLALAKVFERASIDEDHIALAGFSDGGSYALSLGLANSTLFTHIIAFSPGYMLSAGETGRPRIFVAHGADDPILPALRCSRRIVSRLERDGYDVRFEQFTGDHTVPREVSMSAVGWFLGR